MGHAPLVFTVHWVHQIRFLVLQDTIQQTLRLIQMLLAKNVHQDITVHFLVYPHHKVNVMKDFIAQKVL